MTYFYINCKRFYQPYQLKLLASITEKAEHVKYYLFIKRMCKHIQQFRCKKKSYLSP